MSWSHGWSPGGERGPPTTQYQLIAGSPVHPSTRAVITVDVTRVSDSCGWGVPVMDLAGERDLLRLQAEKKGADGMSEYRIEKNSRSIDGLPGMPSPDAPGPVG